MCADFDVDALWAMRDEAALECEREPPKRVRFFEDEGCRHEYTHEDWAQDRVEVTTKIQKRKKNK